MKLTLSIFVLVCVVSLVRCQVAPAAPVVPAAPLPAAAGAVPAAVPAGPLPVAPGAVVAQVAVAVNTTAAPLPDIPVTKCCGSNFFGDYFDPTAEDTCSCLQSTAEEFEGSFCCSTSSDEEDSGFGGIFDIFDD